MFKAPDRCWRTIERPQGQPAWLAGQRKIAERQPQQAAPSAVSRLLLLVPPGAGRGMLRDSRQSGWQPVRGNMRTILEQGARSIARWALGPVILAPLRSLAGVCFDRSVAGYALGELFWARITVGRVILGQNNPNTLQIRGSLDRPVRTTYDRSIAEPRITPAPTSTAIQAKRGIRA